MSSNKYLLLIASSVLLAAFEGLLMRRNQLFSAQPYPVESALKCLGANLRKARIRRRLTIARVAAKTGAGAQRSEALGQYDRVLQRYESR